MKYKAMVRIMGGACWATGETKGEAMRLLKKQLRQDWRHIIDIDKWLKSGTAEIDLFEDKGTNSHDDDVYIASVPLI